MAFAFNESTSGRRASKRVLEEEPSPPASPVESEEEVEWENCPFWPCDDCKAANWSGFLTCQTCHTKRDTATYSEGGKLSVRLIARPGTAGRQQAAGSGDNMFWPLARPMQYQSQMVMSGQQWNLSVNEPAMLNALVMSGLAPMLFMELGTQQPQMETDVQQPGTASGAQQPMMSGAQQPQSEKNLNDESMEVEY